MVPEREGMGLEKAKYTAAVVLYGTIGMFLRYVNLPSEFVALCRGAIGSIFILAFLRLRRKSPDWKAIRKNLRMLAVSGVCLGLNWIFLFAAYMHTTVAIASLCNYLAPLIVILLTPAVLHEKLEVKKLPCVAAAAVGIVLVSGVGGGGTAEGVAFGLAAAACFVAIVICNRKIHDVGALDKSIVQLGVSALTVLPYFLFHNRGIHFQPDLRSLLIVAMLGIVHTGLAYCLYFSGMAKLPVQTVAVLGYLEPVVSVLCSVLFLNEKMNWTGWLGAVLVIGAAVASEMIGKKDGRAA